MLSNERQTGLLARARRPILAAIAATLVACGVSASPTAAPTVAPTAALSATMPPTATVAAAAATPTTAAAASPTAIATTTRAQGIGVTPMAAGPAPAFVDIRTAIVAYLEKSGGSVEGLSAAVAGWGMVSRAQTGESFMPPEPPAVAADFDGDGEDEVAVIAEDPDSTYVVGASVVLIVDATAGRYGITYDAATPDNTTGAAALLSIDDANGDTVADLSYAVVNCGAHTCFYEVSVVSYEGSKYANLSPGVSVPYPDLIAVRNEEGDKRLEIVFHGGTMGSVGAGPQRTSTLIYALDGGTYTLARVVYDPSDLLLFRVVDANTALAAGRTAQAIALYEQARDDQGLKASGMMLNGMTEVEEDAALRSFARFRLLVAETLAGDQHTARSAYDDATTGGGPYAPVAEAYWSAYLPDEDVNAGCAAVTQYAIESPEAVDILNGFGYANPWFAAEDVCQGAGTGQ